MKNPPLRDDGWRKSPGKKDTKRWCRGKAGVDHDPEMVMAPWALSLGRKCHPSDAVFSTGGWACYHDERCKNCGRVMAWSVSDHCPIK